MKDKHSPRPGSAIERIGELSMNCKGSPAAASEPLATVVARDFDVKIEFTYTPGEPARLSGAFEDSCEGCAPELIIKAIKADAAVHFDGEEGISVTAARGTCLMPLFTGGQIGALADRLLDGAGKGEEP